MDYDFSTLITLMPELIDACWQTALMLGIGLAAAVIFGGPLGIWLWWCSPHGIAPHRGISTVIGGTVNLVRSFPFIILLVSLGPLTRMITGTSIGPIAAAVPLSCAAIPYFARLLEQTLRDIPRGVIEAAQAMGASPWQIIYKVLLLEGRAGIVANLTLLSISFLSYSAVAGVVGGGGIGDFAIRYGYYRFQTDVMIVTVALLVIVVQVIQSTGYRLAKALDKR